MGINKGIEVFSMPFCFKVVKDSFSSPIDKIFEEVKLKKLFQISEEQFYNLIEKVLKKSFINNTELFIK